MKRLMACLFILTLTLPTLFSCGMPRPKDPNGTAGTQPVIEYVQDGVDAAGEPVYKCVYNGVSYYNHGAPYCFFYTDLSRDALLRSDGVFDKYYGDTKENPFYISKISFKHSTSYFREDDDDYRSDIFCLEGTDIEAPLSAFFDFDRMEGPFSFSELSAASSYDRVLLLSAKDNPHLRCALTLYDAGGAWYVYDEDTDYLYRAPLSDEMVRLLKENGYIIYDFIP